MLFKYLISTTYTRQKWSYESIFYDLIKTYIKKKEPKINKNDLKNPRTTTIYSGWTAPNFIYLVAKNPKFADFAHCMKVLWLDGITYEDQILSFNFN